MLGCIQGRLDFGVIMNFVRKCKPSLINGTFIGYTKKLFLLYFSIIKSILLPGYLFILFTTIYPVFLIQDDKVVAPYAVKDNNWIGFDDEKSIKIKSEYIKREGFAGGMIWSIDTDDFHGFCTGTKFGLISIVAEVLPLLNNTVIIITSN